jgi:hypothetical protein
MRERQQKEFDTFPLFAAFSNEQFNEGMASLGLSPDDTGKIYHIGGGCYIRRTDADALHEMTNRHDAELRAAMDADETGDGFLLEAWYYELANHEYCITYDITDAREALGLTVDEINSDDRHQNALKKAAAVASRCC